MGPIPASFGKLRRLRVLRLFSNHLSGPIPAELSQLTQLEVLDLSEFDIIGPGTEKLRQRLLKRGRDCAGQCPAFLVQTNRCHVQTGRLTPLNRSPFLGIHFPVTGTIYVVDPVKKRVFSPLGSTTKAVTTCYAPPTRTCRIAGSADVYRPVCRMLWRK